MVRLVTIDTTTAVITFVANTLDYVDGLAWGIGVLPPPSLTIGLSTEVTDDGWIVDIIDHDFNVLQSFRPEALHFVKRIRAVEDFDCEISNSARNFDGDLVVGRKL